MWCKTCRQDVPAVSGAADEQPCCIRCGQVIISAVAKPGLRQQRRTVLEGAAAPDSWRASSAPPAAKHLVEQRPGAEPQVPTVPLRAPLSAFDTWEVEEQLEHIDRILSGTRFITEVRHPPATEPHAPSSVTRTKFARLPALRRGHSRARIRMAWSIVAAGAAALGCGIVLLAAGTLIGRPGWQSVGLPITLLGQVALLLGMMLQLDLVWKGKRETASKLYRFQKRLLDLEALAAELAPTAVDDPSAPADERELIVELKTRLDVLSHRLNLPCG